MKKFLVVTLILCSVVLNVKYLAGRYFHRPASQVNVINPFYESRSSQFALFPVRAGDVVMLGNSLTDMFDLADFFGNPHIRNRGIAGDTSGGVLRRLGPILSGRPKKVFLEVGINDLRNRIPIDHVLSNIDSIIADIQMASDSTQIYLQSIFPVNGALYGDRDLPAMIPPANALLRQLAEKKRCIYVDTFDAFKIGDNLNPKYDCGDGLHLNADGYLRWKEIIEKYVSS